MRTAIVFALLLLAGCGTSEEPLPPVDVRIRLEAGARSVHPGQSVSLDVVRTWKKGLEPSPWDDAMLSPLVVRAEGVERREDARRIQECRRFRAYVFARQDARVPAVPFAARPEDGGELRIAASRPLRLRVMPEVDAQDPGAPELPGPLPERGTPWGWLLLALAGVGGITTFVVVRRRRPAPIAPPEPPSRPDLAALAALEKLRAGAAADPARDVVTTGDIVRTFVGARFGLDVHARTTEELDHAVGAGPVLVPADRVKFAAHQPDTAERDERIEAAIEYVGERSA